VGAADTGCIRRARVWIRSHGSRAGQGQLLKRSEVWNRAGTMLTPSICRVALLEEVRR